VKKSSTVKIARIVVIMYEKTLGFNSNFLGPYIVKPTDRCVG